MKTGLALLIIVAMATAVVHADDKLGARNGTPDMEISDTNGTKHIISGCHEDSRFFRSGTPFRDGSFYKGAPLLGTLIAINLHTPSEQDKISKIAIENGNRKSESDNFQVVLLIPLSAIDDIAFTGTEAGDETAIKSKVRLAGGVTFDAGMGYAKLVGKEDLGALGTKNISLWMEKVREIKSSVPSPFVGDFRFFAAPEVPPKVKLKDGVYYGNSSIQVVKPLDLSTAAPFKVRVTDAAGTDIILEKALFCESDHELTGEKDGNGNYYDSTCNTLIFTSDLKAVRSGSKLSIASSKLNKVKLGKVNKGDADAPGFDANVILRSGEAFDLTITPRDGIYVPNGIIGYSPKGWVWIPWQAVSNMEFEDK